MSRMNILALDTSTEACSAALLGENKIISRFEVKPNQHSHLLLPMIDELLAEAGLNKTQLDAIAFGCGPGSFTGLRIAASVAQGIAFAQDLPVIPISSLQTMAQAAYQAFGYKKVLVAIDAHVQSLYYGMFEYHIKNKCIEKTAPEALVSANLWQAPEGDSWHHVGNGWRYFDFEAKIDYYPKADALLILAKKAFEQKQWVKPEEALPVYLHELAYLKK